MKDHYSLTYTREYFDDLNPKSIKVVVDPNTGRSKGFAYLEFSDQESLQKALCADGEVPKCRDVN